MMWLRDSLANQPFPSLWQLKNHNLGPCKNSATQKNKNQMNKWNHCCWPPHQIGSPPSPLHHLQHLSGLLTILLFGTHHNVHACALQSSTAAHFLALFTHSHQILSTTRDCRENSTITLGRYPLHQFWQNHNNHDINAQQKDDTIMNSSNTLPWLPTEFISSWQWV
jgi:hypothetical protein